MPPSIHFDRDQLEELCRQFHVKSLGLFGSRLTGNSTQESDLDLLVEFDPEHIPGIFEFVGLERKLSELFHLQVDLNTPNFLSTAFRDTVKREEKPIYVES